MNIIIVGAGEIGRYLASSLSLESHRVVLIEANEALVNELDSQLDAKVVNGSGTDASVLLEAGIAECQLFLALTSSSSVNLMASSVAKKLGATKVITRVEPKLEREDWLFDYRSHFDIDHLFSSERLSAIELAKFIRNPDAIVVEEVARGRIEVQQVTINDSSPDAGKSLHDLKAPARTRVAMISRDGETIVPTAQDELHPGDLATIFGDPRGLKELSDRLQKTKTSGLRVVIFGGGEYGFCLAQMLESYNCKVRIFEKDPHRAQELSDRLSDTTVINTDATYVAELEEEQVGEADFFVATSDSDEDNVMTCLQAHNLGAKKCLTLIHRADYADAISHSGRDLGMAAAVSPREATRRDLNRFISSDQFHTVRKLSSAEVIETELAEGARAAGKKVSEVEWPEGCVLVGTMRGIRSHVPTGDDLLEPGDVLYAIVAPKARKKFLKLVR